MIRIMKETDWDEMMSIYGQSLKKGDVTFRTDYPTYEEWDKSHIKECRFVYEENGQVVGYTMIAPTSSRDSYRGVVEVSIFVDEKHCKKGIGTALLSKLMEAAREEGYWTLYSAIFSVNKESIRLHKKCGFRIIGTREKIAKDKFGNWQSTTIMEWRNDIEESVKVFL